MKIKAIEQIIVDRNGHREWYGVSVIDEDSGEELIWIDRYDDVWNVASDLLSKLTAKGAIEEYSVERKEINR